MRSNGMINNSTVLNLSVDKKNYIWYTGNVNKSQFQLLLPTIKSKNQS